MITGLRATPLRGAISTSHYATPLNEPRRLNRGLNPTPKHRHLLTTTWVSDEAQVVVRERGDLGKFVQGFSPYICPGSVDCLVVLARVTRSTCHARAGGKQNQTAADI